MKKCCSLLVFILFLSFIFVLKVEALSINYHCRKQENNKYLVNYTIDDEVFICPNGHKISRDEIHDVSRENSKIEIEKVNNKIWFYAKSDVSYQMIKISKEQIDVASRYAVDYHIYYEILNIVSDKYNDYINIKNNLTGVTFLFETCVTELPDMQKLRDLENDIILYCGIQRNSSAYYAKNNFINSIPTYNSSNWKKATKDQGNRYSAKVPGEGYYVVWATAEVNGVNMYKADVFQYEKQKVNETKNLEIGATYTLPVKGSGYKSSNTAVATVSNDGIITAKSGGTATITYTTDTTNYTIVINTHEMQIGTAPLLGNPITLKSGETATATNIEITDNLTWYSDDEKIASVKNGVITGGYKGKTIIHAYNDTISYTVEVEVTSKPKAQGSKEIETVLGGTVNIKDFYDKSILDPVISVKSENEKIATIDTSLNVKGDKVGSTNVIIEYEDHFLEIAVKVLNKVEIKDETTSIPDENKNYLKLETKKIEANTKDYEEVKKKIKGITSFELYDINLYKGNQKIQPDSPIYLLLDIPQGYDHKKIVVYRIEENGSMTKLESTIENGKIKFLTNHFSYYIVAEETVQGGSKTESVNIKNLSNTTTQTTENNAKEEIENPQTGKVISITLILISILLIGAIIIYTRKNKKIFSI